MTAAHVHLMSVHVPVVGALLALALLLLGHILRRDLLIATAYGLLVACAAGAAVAYYSGPSAYEQLESELVSEKAWVEQHAVIGRAFFVGLVLTAVVALQALLQFAQDEPPPRWQRLVILGLLLATCHLALWSAHLGGAIRHQEIRTPEWRLFPHLEDPDSTPRPEPISDSESERSPE